MNEDQPRCPATRPPGGIPPWLTGAPCDLEAGHEGFHTHYSITKTQAVCWGEPGSFTMSSEGPLS